MQINKSVVLNTTVLTGSDVEGSLGLEAVLEGLLDDGGDPAHVFVGRVCAGSDEAVLYLQRPAVLLGGLAQGADGRGQIGGEWAVHVGLKLGQVDLDQLIVLAARV